MRERINHMTEGLCRYIAHRLPRGIVYFAAIRLVAHATTGKYGNTNPSVLSAMDAVKRWE